MSVLLRPARPDDLVHLRRWDEEEHVRDSGGDPEFNDWNWEEELNRTPPWREFLIAEVEGRPIGFIQIIDPKEEESHYWGDCDAGLRAIDIWIGEEECLNRGYGTQMMRIALERCFAARSATAVLIDPMADNVRAHRFYERLGFRFVERRSFGPDDCCVYRLERADWEKQRGA